MLYKFGIIRIELGKNKEIPWKNIVGSLKLYGCVCVSSYQLSTQLH